MNTFENCKKLMKETFPEIGVYKLESIVEGLQDWNILHSLDEIKKWFELHRENPHMNVEQVPLNQVEGWSVDANTGNISHSSGEFFVINGARITSSVNREVGTKGWDQPMLEQIGHDGGILGLVRKRINGIPHYLVEAKAEPGNYKIIQMSPTLQATFSNLKMAHGGSKPKFAELFEAPENFDGKVKVLYKAWLSEDGGRLFNKRNLGMMIEVDADMELEIDNNFIWVSLYQIKELLHEDAWVNPHIRGIIAHM